MKEVVLKKKNNPLADWADMADYEFR